MRAYNLYSFTKERQFAIDYKTPGKSSGSIKTPAAVAMIERRIRQSAVLYSLFFVNLLYSAMWIFLSMGVFARAPVIYNYILSQIVPAVTIVTLTAKRGWCASDSLIFSTNFNDKYISIIQLSLSFKIIVTICIRFKFAAALGDIAVRCCFALFQEKMFSTVTDINRLGESLLICNRSAEEILTGLYNIKHLLQPEQYNFIDSVVGDGTNRTQTPKSSWPRIFSDQSMQVLLKTFLRRYPEHPASEISKLPIYYAFATDAKGIADEASLIL